MDVAEAHALYETFTGEPLTFLYSGTFHDEHTARLIDLGEEFLRQDPNDRGHRGKLAFVLVEAYQNIVRHRAVLPADQRLGEGRSVFLVRGRVLGQEITAINPVTTADAARLAADLKRLEGLDMQQMKQVFLRSLQNDERTDRGGAGLGLIEMARRSGNPLRHGFVDLDTEHRLFGIQVFVGKAAGRRTGPPPDMGLHRMVRELGITLLCRGAITPPVQEILLRMIERDPEVDAGIGERTKGIFLLAIGAMGAMEPAGDGPMIVMRSLNGVMSLAIAAPVDHGAAKRLAEAVDSINHCDPPTLQRRYRDILLGRAGAAGGLELGLMDLVRRGQGPLKLGQMPAGARSFVLLEVGL